jgi:hypothetical protein
MRLISQLNGLFRDERSAVEAYQDVILKIEKGVGITDLHRICGSHIEAANLLREHIVTIGGIPDRPNRESGTWISLMQSVMNVSAPLGDGRTLRTLAAGEASALKECERVLHEPALTPQTCDLVKVQLVTRIQRHISQLQRMIRGD